MDVNFCNACGKPVEHRVPDGDNLPRHICPACGHIQYFNPRMIVGCIPEWEDGRILMCKRNILPRIGKWTVPAGCLEMGEIPWKDIAFPTIFHSLEYFFEDRAAGQQQIHSLDLHYKPRRHRRQESDAAQNPQT